MSKETFTIASDDAYFIVLQRIKQAVEKMNSAAKVAPVKTYYEVTVGTIESKQPIGKRRVRIEHGDQELEIVEKLFKVINEGGRNPVICDDLPDDAVHMEIEYEV